MRFDRRRIERWLASLLMCGLMVNVHLIGRYRAALADDPLLPFCLPQPVPPEMQQLLDTQEAVYAAVFAATFDPCDDSGLLLDAPLDGAQLPAFATGTNSAGEEFGFEVLEWFDPDYCDLSPEDRALISD